MPPQVNIVATVSKGADDLSTVTSTAVDTTNADCILALVESGFGVTFSDSAGNTGWADCGAGNVQVGNSGNTYARILFKKNPVTSASHTFTVSGSFQVPRFTVFALSNTSSSPIGLFNTKQLSSGTSITLNSLTPDDDGSLLLLAVALTAGDVTGYDSGFTSDGTSGVVIGVNAAHLLQSSKGPVAPTASWASAASAAAILLAVKPTPPPSPAVMTAYPNTLRGRLAVVGY